MMFTRPIGKFRPWPAALLIVLAGMAGPVVHAESLRTELSALAQRNGFQIEGLDQIGNEPARPTEGDASRRIKSLLADYNFMIIGQGNKIERVTISSLKNVSARPKGDGVVKTQRMGAHHQVQAILNGPNQSDIAVSLLVDTGATTVVLPASMIGPLGFSRGGLQDGYSQTAAGRVVVKTGLLKLLRVGEVSAENVPVSFINDQKLNGASLLGMSFLNRFRFSLDDEKSELVLTPK